MGVAVRCLIEDLPHGLDAGPRCAGRDQRHANEPAPIVQKKCCKLSLARVETAGLEIVGNILETAKLDPAQPFAVDLVGGYELRLAERRERPASCARLLQSKAMTRRERSHELLDYCDKLSCTEFGQSGFQSRSWPNLLMRARWL